MNIISFIIWLLIVGVVLYVVEAVLPINAQIKMVIEAVVVIAVLIYLLQSLGVLGGNSIHLR